MKRHKEQGIYRIKRAIHELSLMDETIDDIEDQMDKDNAKLAVDEIKWCIEEGLKDLLDDE